MGDYKKSAKWMCCDECDSFLHGASGVMRITTVIELEYGSYLEAFNDTFTLERGTNESRDKKLQNPS